MKCVKPKLFPHWGTYSYSQWGFRHRLKPRLMARGFTQRQVEELEGIYFCRRYLKHMDEKGVYWNRRQNRLYRLARSVGRDRKQGLFGLVERSGLFVCFYGGDGQLVAFQSPRVGRDMGVISFGLG